MSGRRLGARLLAKDVSETICTAHANDASMQTSQNSMISSQGPPCFSHQKNRPQEPSRAHALSVLPICAELHLPTLHLCHGHSQLSKQQPWHSVRCKLITSDSKSAFAGKAAAVQAEFAQTGIYPESWLQGLGTEQLSQQLQKQPRLLLRKPDECSKVCLWLMSKGVNAARVQQKAPVVMTREIRAVQSTFEALQQAAAFSDAQAVSTLLGMLMTSDSFRAHIIAAHDRLFHNSPVTLHQRVTFFCQMYATGTHVVRTALTTGVFMTPEPVMQARAAKLQEMLGWDSEQLRQKLSATPNLLNHEPSTIARNVHEMRAAGFSQTQVWAMCTQHPALLGLKWTSDTNVEKLQFLTCFLGLTLDDIAARPRLLGCSVSSFLGPRVWFLYQTGAIEAPNTVMTSGLFGRITLSTVLFSKRFGALSAFPSMMFDSAFIDHWRQRWEFLRQHMKLSVETIAAHQELLLTSLPDRLAPRWQLLSCVVSEHAAFKAEDHLTALATLSDQDFEQVFQAKMGSLYTAVISTPGCPKPVLA
ncbi:MAG: hypothetical protein FRX49_11226 [Trebouxia sp. A1-2]|nr:MAG: hypothetical protein FRX49_11226 [Trebouxia sp. A1-2]